MRHAWTHLTVGLAVLVILAGGVPAAWAGSHSAMSPEFSLDTRNTDPVTPDGEFTAQVDVAAVAGGKGWWDLTGTYATEVAGKSLVMHILHDTCGRVTGTATYGVVPATVVTMPIKGRVKGSAGSITMAGTLRGADAARTVTVSLVLNLTVDSVNRQLTGHLTGGIKAGGVTTPVSAAVSLPVPPPMDGTWTLRFQLGQVWRRLTGTAVLTLSNGVDYGFEVKGRAAGTVAVLSLVGGPAGMVSRAIRIRTVITPLEDGLARLETFSGRGYGQTVEW